MSTQWKFLITCLHNALGQFLEQVDLHSEDRPTSTPSSAPPKSPAVKTEPTQPAAEVTPPTVEAPPAVSEPEVPVPTPTIEELRDPGYSRMLIERFLVSRGFEQEAVSKMVRPELNRTAIAQVEQLNTAGAGARKRTKKDAGEKPESKKPTAESVLAELPAEHRAAVARMLNVDPAAPDVIPQLVQLLGTAEAVNEVVPVALQGASEESAPVATVQITTETPAPLPSSPPKPSRKPSVPSDPPEETAAAPEVKKADGPGAHLLAHITQKYGVNGVLMNTPPDGEVVENIPVLQKMIQDGLKSNVPAKVARYTNYTEKLGCSGRCIECPRGGAQMAACLTVFDKEYAASCTPPGGEEVNNVNRVIAGELLVRFAGVQGDVWDEAFEDGPAQVEVIR